MNPVRAAVPDERLREIGDDMARTADEWFEAYGHSHQNGINKLIHWVCVPLITVTLLALLWEIPTGPLQGIAPWFHWAYVLVAIAVVFYLRLSLSIAFGMLIATACAIAIFIAWPSWFAIPMWQVALALFVLAWIGQFIGHAIEGEKPSFLEDIQFLLVGPAWLLHFIYRKVGIPY